ncbi:MAG: glycerol dehydrogenase [Prolixibacteraceae bacterium]|nr:glycerol dehydrogenase [Prolixibacteraceae bacterium]
MMERYTKAVFPGKYIQGENAIKELPELIKLLGNKGLILGSRTVIKKILPDYPEFEKSGIIEIEKFIGECCESEIKRVYDLIQSKKIDVLIGMGGGKTIDTAKIASDRANIPLIIVPTIASTDAPCSGCAVIYSEGSVFESVYYQKMNPQVVLVDLNIIVKSPVRFLVAGMGDALATWFEAKSCERTHSLNECGGYGTMTGLNLARLCYDTVLLYGKSAKIACDNKIVTPAFSHIVEANILLSGLGFESSGLAGAHAIHNGLTVLEDTHSSFHGEKVAFGLLTSLHLTDEDPGVIEKVYSFCREIGLPTTLSDIGVRIINKEKLMQAAVKACDPNDCLHHEAGIITPEKVYNAMLIADEYGKILRLKNRI